MKHIYLIRHCQATGQEPSAPLTVEGHEQAKLLAQRLQHIGIEMLISSPYVRALHSLKPTAEMLSKPIVVDERLEERLLSTCNLPDWMEKLEQTFKDMDVKYDGGESSREAAARGLSVISDALNKDTENIAIMTHGNLMSLILNHYDSEFGFEQWKQLSNPDVFVLRFDEERIAIERIWSYEQEEAFV